MITKICSRCNLTKDISLFSNKNWCKQCKSEYDKLYREKNSQKIKEKSKRYYKNNTEMLKIKVKKYEKENVEKYKETSKKYREKNAEKIREKKKQEYQNNKEKVKLRSKIWKENNKDKINKKISIYFKNKTKNDPIYRLMRICGCLVGNMLRSLKSSKNFKSSKDYFPFTGNELKLSIESKFDSWMSWQNQGIYSSKKWIDNDVSTYCWNLDHWIPQALLPYSSMEDKNFKIAWSLSNLRPISAKQNILENFRRSIDKVYTEQEYKDLSILIDLLKDIIDTSSKELILFYNSMIKAKEQYENTNISIMSNKNYDNHNTSSFSLVEKETKCEVLEQKV